MAALLLLGTLLLAAVVVVSLFVSRQRTLSRRVGSFGCLLRPDPPLPGGSWTVGRAQYATDRLVWWRTVSLAPRPARTWSRSALEIVERQPLDAIDDQGRALVLVRCRHGEEAFQMTLSAPALAGLVSWLEAGPRPVGRVL